MKPFRLSLASLYVLATLAGSGWHDHGPRADGPAAIAAVGCDDPSPHYAGHPAPDWVGSDLHCPACQVRAEHRAEPEVSVGLPVAVAPLSTPEPTSLVRPRSTRRPSPRAPPSL